MIIMSNITDLLWEMGYYNLPEQPLPWPHAHVRRQEFFANQGIAYSVAYEVTESSHTLTFKTAQAELLFQLTYGHLL